MTAIDLSQLPAPEIVEELGYEQILQDYISQFKALYPDFDADVESDPVYKLLEVAAYREFLLRQRVNDASKGVMLAFAKGSDLDQLGGNFNLQRFVIQEADTDAIPPVPELLEDDDAFRGRIQLALEGLTTAGSEGSYIAHAKNASSLIKDVRVTSPAASEVLVSVLVNSGDGTPSSGVLDRVRDALNAENVRPLTDDVTVQAAAIQTYDVVADLEIYDAPDIEVVRQQAESQLRDYVTEAHRVGGVVAISGLHKALHVAGVKSVNLTSPTLNIISTSTQAPYCSSITVTKTAVES